MLCGGRVLMNFRDKGNMNNLSELMNKTKNTNESVDTFVQHKYQFASFKSIQNF